MQTNADNTMEPGRGVDLESTGATNRYTSNGEVRELLADVDDLVKKVAHIKDLEVARVRDKVTQAAQATRESMTRGARQVQTRTRSAATATDTYVHTNPWTALGLAAAVGVLVGLMTRR